MSAKTKIVVLRMKEIIYTAIFIGLAILLIALFLIMFRRDKESVQPESSSAEASYTPGVYSSSISLGNGQVNVEVTVDANHINSITLKPLSDSVAAMYPLVEPAMQSLTEQILKNQSLDAVSYQSEQKYTSAMLLKAIQSALDKAAQTASLTPFVS
ncbi:MAG: hypothetical protein HFG49_01075 [Lachnospiraceae bacterium]|jgi:uncharacterized protein with FMN-binding domain|nr:hypothetical protein [Lachnospiraceae bacterium]